MSTAIPVWQILAFLGVFLVVTLAWSWFRDQYEPVWTGRLPRFTRRWYGLRAHVCFKSGCEPPDRHEVIEWGDDSTDVPWLCVRNIDLVSYEDGPPEPFWAPLTDFSPYAVRRFHPVWALRSLLEGRPVSPFSYDTLPAPPASGRVEVDA
jgi:hypothetical protein